MLDKPQTFEVSAEDIEVIEAALQTQSQILNVQATAGGSAARDRLDQVRRVLGRLTRNRPAQSDASKLVPCPRSTVMQWLFGTQKSC